MTLKRGLLALALAALVAAPAVRAETLADAMAAAYENSGLLEQNRALLRAADEDVAQAMASLRPVINWQATATYTNPTSFFGDDIEIQAQILAEITLWDGGRSQFVIDAQKEIVLGTRERLLSVEQQVLLRAVEAYMNVRRNGAFVDLRESNVRLITQELRAAQDRFDVGEVTRTDVALAEARLAAARSLLAAEQGQLARAIEEFRAAVGRAPQGLAPASPAGISQTLAAAQDIAVRNHPAIAEAQFTVSAAELNILAAEAAMDPTVSLSARMSITDEWQSSESVSLTASGPIYQGGRLSSVVRQFMARRDAARANLLTTVQLVEQNVANAWSFLEVARASRDASDRQVRAATVAFEGIREEATLGARTTLDVLNAEQELLDARANLISAQVDETIATYTLLATMGALTAEDLQLRVQLYDPAAYYNLVRDAPAIVSEQGRALDRVLESIGD
jgi:outer membrane protein